MKNIVYKNDDIKDYFSKDRIKWDDFYDSEKKVIEKVFKNSINNLVKRKILDVGCACGGLGMAIREKYGLNNYTGIEINPQAADYAKKINPEFKIISGDFLEVSDLLPNEHYDFVFSLSCVDWQNNFFLMLKELFKKIKPGGYFIGSFRLSSEESINDISKSFQYINYNGEKKGEIAPYVVFNINDLLASLKKFNISDLYAYGYNGKPSITAVTDYKELYHIL